AVRRRHPAFGRGTATLLYPKNRKILAYLREYQDDVLLCVAPTSPIVRKRRSSTYRGSSAACRSNSTPVHRFHLSETSRISSPCRLTASTGLRWHRKAIGCPGIPRHQSRCRNTLLSSFAKALPI